jgi:Protein of unknown function (DUF3313)
MSRARVLGLLLGIELLLAGMCASVAGPPQKLPPPFDDLVQVRSPQLGAVYLLPGTDFSGYTKVMIDPVQVSFRKGWLKSENNSRGVATISQTDAEQIAQAVRSGFQDVFVAAFKDKGYEVVSTPAADVLRLSPAVANLYINAPMPADSAPGVASFTVGAGEASLVLEARDSTTGAVLGLALDRREAQQAGLATSVGNRAAFEDLFKTWGYICVKGLDRLKAASPQPGPKAGKK